MRRIEVPYLIVGAGPVGMTAAKLFDATGLACMLVERRDGPLRHPAAHVVNARSLEIFRQAGFDMDAIQAIASHPDDAGHVNFVTTLAGELVGRLPFERQGPEIFELSPTPLRNISQHRLEPLLARDLAGSPLVDVRYRTEWVSCTQDDSGVTSIVRDLDTGDEIEIRSTWLLGADGAGSRVRKSLDIEMVGPIDLRSSLAIHFSAELRTMVADRPGVLHFVLEPGVHGTLIAHDLDGEWVLMRNFDPAVESADDYDDERATRLVHESVGDASVDVEILNVGSWHMTAQVADSMRRDRVFLVGDAAHRFPPTGGLGLNTGVGDVHNLVWKLAANDQGRAAASLLDTYESERRPIAETNCEQSLENAFKMVTLIDALGIPTDPSREGVLARLADPAHAESIAAAVEDQATHFDMIGLQLGYAYAEGAIVHDGPPPGPVEDPRIFEPSATTGARLPHAWLNEVRSTLDLVPVDRFVLLSTGSHDEWAELSANANAPLDHVRLGVDTPPLAEFRDRFGLADGSALLLRPDQHIAWRATAPSVELGSALQQVLSPAVPAPSGA